MKLLNLYIVGFNVDSINLKDILLVKYDDYDKKELESLNNHLDEFDLESKCNNKNIKGKKNKKFYNIKLFTTQKLRNLLLIYLYFINHKIKIKDRIKIIILMHI